MKWVGCGGFWILAVVRLGGGETWIALTGGVGGIEGRGGALCRFRVLVAEDLAPKKRLLILRRLIWRFG